ncbi:OprD family outer membrane porin [Neptuniibacter sp. QD72_48]|uniref:OprD family outer membrane porin n=1 Tax=unclassified Neptuniibacter TaxID=2630693 RepID=UPI0039F68A23
MFQKKLSVAALAFGAVASGSSIAAEAQNDGFKVDLGLRTFYMNRDFDQGIPDTIAAGQAFKLDVASPYFGGFVGFDATVTEVVALENDKTDNLSDVLAAGGNGYTAVENLYVKLKPLDNVNIRAGRMVMMTPLLNDLQSRLSAPSTQAIYGDIALDNMNLYAFYSDEASRNTRQGFDEYEVNGEDYGIASVGGDYTFANGLKAEVQYAVADDYMKQSWLNLTYPTKMGEYDVTLDARHMRGEDDGHLLADYDSHLTSLTARFAKGNWAYTVNYQTVGGNDGYNVQWGGQDDTQYFTYGAVQLLDFNADDEQALQFRVDYDVPSIPGLHLMARHTEAWDIDYDGGTDGQRRETNLDAKYTVQSGKAKDLSVQLRVAQVNGDDSVVPNISDIRLILDYPINLL